MKKKCFVLKIDLHVFAKSRNFWNTFLLIFSFIVNTGNCSWQNVSIMGSLIFVRRCFFFWSKTSKVLLKNLGRTISVSWPSFMVKWFMNQNTILLCVLILTMTSQVSRLIEYKNLNKFYFIAEEIFKHFNLPILVLTWDSAIHYIVFPDKQPCYMTLKKCWTSTRIRLLMDSIWVWINGLKYNWKLENR